MGRYSQLYSAKMKNKILLVEDELDMSLIVADTLCTEGYDVATAADGASGLNKFITEGADLVIADVMMPKMDGFEMARLIRRKSVDIPIIFLTAKSGIDDVEKGFDLGANDYLRKPFELRELIARVKALLRSTTQFSVPVYQIGRYTFDTTTQKLIIDNHEIELSNIEARLLELLATNIGRTVDASAMMTAIWQRDEPSNRNSMHGYIHKLRQALRLDSNIAIVNQRAYGYMLTVAI